MSRPCMPPSTKWPIAREPQENSSLPKKRSVRSTEASEAPSSIGTGGQDLSAFAAARSEFDVPKSMAYTAGRNDVSVRMGRSFDAKPLRLQGSRAPELGRCPRPQEGFSTPEPGPG